MDFLVSKSPHNDDDDIQVESRMDDNPILRSPCLDDVDSFRFTKENMFKAVAEEKHEQLHGLLKYLRDNNKRLSSPEFRDKNGKTALLKALMNLKDCKNEAIKVLLDTADQTGDLKAFVNASYTDPHFKGQTALHVAIERRSLEYVKLLVQKGADVQAKANGSFFQDKSKKGFYFGELPLSLAACSNQPDMVSFLMENPYSRADVTDTDSQGNTVLHTLVIIADNKQHNTEILSEMYDKILVQDYRVKKNRLLELIENKEGLTPLKLAAKLGKVGMLQHILNREFQDEELKPLSRKFTEWVFGPVHTSLYDMSSIDTSEDNSVLEIIVFKSAEQNRPEMLQIEPLSSFLQDKWEKVAYKLFLINFVSFIIYLVTFTAVAYHRKDGQPPFPVENTPGDIALCLGGIVSVLGAVWFLYKSVRMFLLKNPSIWILFTDGIFEILFFLQGSFLLISTLLFFCGWREYVGILVLSVALTWINVLYYARGIKHLGIYVVMMQRMIFGDLLHFLFIYSVLLSGFSAAVVTLIDSPTTLNGTTNETQTGPESSFEVQPVQTTEPGYHDLRFTVMEMFKFTIGMGNLEFSEHIENRTAFYVLLITYIVLTFILMFNMLIALMGNTVGKTSEESKNIWKLQRALTILDMERTLPRWLRNKINPKLLDKVCTADKKHSLFFRVAEKDWGKWRSNICAKLHEDPSGFTKQAEVETSGTSRNQRRNLRNIFTRKSQPQTLSVVNERSGLMDSNKVKTSDV